MVLEDSRQIFIVGSIVSANVCSLTGLARKDEHCEINYNTSASQNDDLGKTPLGPRALAEGTSSNGGTDSAPQSPYSANRVAVRNLTLPTIPNLDIPLSPPGSPPPGMDAKFEHFLKLKTQGVHFNEKLAKSSALKNPGLGQKLMEFAGIGEEDQYNTTLSEEIWNPKGFPNWAYKEQLAKSNQEVMKKKEEEKLRVQRESIDFVPAVSSANPGRNGVNTVTGGPKSTRASAAERVMAGLDRERHASPKPGRSDDREDTKHRPSHFDDNRSSTNARSPKRRKRSRSR